MSIWTRPSVDDNIKNGKYNTKLPYPNRKDPDFRSLLNARKEDELRLTCIFAADLAEEYEVYGHDKAGLLFEKAWNFGFDDANDHTEGLRKVLGYYDDMVSLIK